MLFDALLLNQLTMFLDSAGSNDRFFRLHNIGSAKESNIRISVLSYVQHLRGQDVGMQTRPRMLVALVFTRYWPGGKHNILI